jgi:hypothetical protein
VSDRLGSDAIAIYGLVVSALGPLFPSGTLIGRFNGHRLGHICKVPPLNGDTAKQAMIATYMNSEGLKHTGNAKPTPLVRKICCASVYQVYHGEILGPTYAAVVAASASRVG